VTQLPLALFGLSATETLTFALVLITGYYALQNGKMAREMRRSREAQIRPKLAIDVHALTPMYVVARVRNVGQGPALDVDVKLTFEPAPDSDADPVVREWRTTVIAPGEHRDFMPPEDLDMEPLARKWNVITLTGQATDAAGSTHTVDEATADLLEQQRRIAALGMLWEEDPERLGAREAREIRKTLEDLTKEAKAIRRVATGQRRRERRFLRRHRRGRWWGEAAERSRLHRLAFRVRQRLSTALTAAPRGRRGAGERRCRG
jgi:hypothetical protein